MGQVTISGNFQWLRLITGGYVSFSEGTNGRDFTIKTWDSFFFNALGTMSMGMFMKVVAFDRMDDMIWIFFRARKRDSDVAMRDISREPINLTLGFCCFWYF